MLSVVILSVIMHSVRLSVVMLSVIMPIVVAPHHEVEDSDFVVNFFHLLAFKTANYAKYAF